MKHRKVILAVALMTFFLVTIRCFPQLGPPTAWTWAKTYDSGNSQQDIGFGLAVDASNNVYVTGFSNVALGNPTDSYIETIKYGPTGAVTWSVTTSVGTGTNCNVEGGFDIVTDGNKVWVSGTTYTNTTNYEDLTLITYSASTGAVLTNYPKRLSDPGCNSTSGLYSQGSCLTEYTGGSGANVYVGGSTYNSGSTPFWNFVVVKDDLTTAGWTWTFTKAGTSTLTASESRATDIEADNNYVYVTGWVTNNTTGKDVFTAKLDATTGSFTCAACWTATYSNSNNLDDIGNVIEVDASGNVYVAGYATTSTGKDGLLLKYNSTGTIQSGYPVIYNKSGFDDAWNDMEVIGTSTVNPAVYVGGYVTTSTTTANSNYALAAYTSTGTLTTSWSTNPVFYDGARTGAEAAGTDNGHAIEYSATKNRVYITGMSDEGGVSSEINIATIGYKGTTGVLDWGVALYDEATDHNPNWIDENRWKYGMEVVYNSTYCTDDIYIEGITVVLGEDQDYLTLKYSCPGTGCTNCLRSQGRTINASEQNSEARFYPNPFADRAELKLDMPVTRATLLIYDATGRLVRNIENITSTSIVIERNNLSKGFYFYKLSENGAALYSGKFIIADQ